MDAAGGRLPTAWPEFAASPVWRSIDFISDLHLTEGQVGNVGTWVKYLETTDADAVFILGDLFEAWVGDDARGDRFEAACIDVLARASRRRTVAFMCGNRDFLVGPAMLADCGVIALQDPTLLLAWGRRVLLTHGDQLCLADVEYQRFRAVARSDAWRAAFLAKPLAERRELARQMRDASAQRQRAQGPAAWADVDTSATLAWLRAAGADDLVHGHTHRPLTEALAPGHQRLVLSDWDVDASTPRAEVLRLTRGGFERRPIPA